MVFKKGYIPTEEHIKKLKEVRKGRTPWNKGLKGIQSAWNKREDIRNDYNKIIEFYNTLNYKEISRLFNCSPGLIYNILKDKNNTLNYSNRIKHLKELNKLTAWNKGLTKDTNNILKKMSDDMKLNPNNSRKGKHHSEKTKELISLANKNKKHFFTEESKIRHKEKRSKQILPKYDTQIEIKIQNYLKELHIEFFTHQYMNKIKHGYQCDIFIPVQKSNYFFIKQPIIIECDGDFFHCNPKFYSFDFVRFPSSDDKRTAKLIWEQDKIKTDELVSKGFRVIRLWENEIKLLNLNEFKENII